MATSPANKAPRVNNDARNAARQANRVARKFGNKGPKAKNLTARAMRRAAGNFKPVNPAASLEQAPTGRFAREGGTVNDNQAA